MRTIALAVVAVALAVTVAAQGRGGAPRPAAVAQPAPRWPNGTINLGAPPGQVGMWDGGEPGKGTDILYVKLNGVELLGASGAFIDQGNMQYHSNCRGPG